jgi:hypothetical protein
MTRLHNLFEPIEQCPLKGVLLARLTFVVLLGSPIGGAETPIRSSPVTGGVD